MKLRKITALMACFCLFSGCAPQHDPFPEPPAQYVPTPATVIPLEETGGIYEIDIEETLHVSDQQEVLILNSYTDKLLYAVGPKAPPNATYVLTELRIYDPETGAVETVATHETSRYGIKSGCLFEGYVVYAVGNDQDTDASFETIRYLDLKTGENKAVVDTKKLSLYDDAFRSQSYFAGIDTNGGARFYLDYMSLELRDGSRAWGQYITVTPDGQTMEISAFQSKDFSATKDYAIDMSNSGHMDPLEPGEAALTVAVTGEGDAAFGSFRYTDPDAREVLANVFLLNEALVSAVYFREACSWADATWMQEWTQHAQAGRYGKGEIFVEHFSGKHYAIPLDTYFPNAMWYPYSMRTNDYIRGGINGKTICFLSYPITDILMVTIDEQGAAFYSTALPVAWSVEIMDLSPVYSGDEVWLNGPRASLFHQSPTLYGTGFVIHNKTAGKLIILQPPGVA